MANLDDLDIWTQSPQGPGWQQVLESAIFRSYYNDTNNRVRWLFNRLASILGTWRLIEEVDPTGNTIKITAHGLPANTVVRVASVGGAVPAGLFNYVGYYVVTGDADHLSLSLTSGGGAVDITGLGSGTLYLYTVPDVLSNIMLQSVTFNGSHTLPAASLGNAFLYVISALGGTFTGPVKFSGNTANRVDRVGDRVASLKLLDQAAQTFTGTQKDRWDVPDVSQNSIYTIGNPTETGEFFSVSRTVVGGGNAALFKRADASTVGRCPNTGVSEITFVAYDNGDGKGLAWHAWSWSGDADNLS